MAERDKFPFEISRWYIKPNSDKKLDIKEVNKLSGEQSYTFKTGLSSSNFFALKMRLELCAKIEKDLEYILNSPSTINKVLTYYSISWIEDGLHCALFFEDYMVKVWIPVVEKTGEVIK